MILLLSVVLGHSAKMILLLSMFSGSEAHHTIGVYTKCKKCTKDGFPLTAVLHKSIFMLLFKSVAQKLFDYYFDIKWEILEMSKKLIINTTSIR